MKSKKDSSKSKSKVVRTTIEVKKIISKYEDGVRTYLGSKTVHV